MKCKYCGYEAPVISRSSNPEDKEFIAAKKIDEHTLASILKCPKCGKEQWKNNNDNGNNKGCRGCKYLDVDPRAWGWPWECWYPRKSKTSPVRVDLERFRKGCKGRKEE